MTYNYIDLLIGEYVQRKAKNKAYSERAFARSLGLSPGFLKLLFQRKKNLSEARADEIARKIGWTELKREKFLSSRRISGNGRKLKSQQTKLSEADFLEISDWYHFAIIELIKTRAGSVSIEQISKALGLSRAEVKFSVKLLEMRSLIRRIGDAQYSLTEYYEMPSVTSDAIRKYHQQTLTLALESVTAQSNETRDLRALTLAFDSAYLSEAKQYIEEFVASFDEKFSRGQRSSVYQMNIALFKLDKEVT
jgi:uncharacterized protein (TIGR02147 family)